MQRNDEKITIIVLVVAVVIFIARIIIAYFLTDMPEIKMPMVKKEKPFASQYVWTEKETYSYSFYEKFIKNNLFVFPQISQMADTTPEKKRISKQSEKQERQEENVFPLRLEGIIWGGKSEKSVVIIKEISTSSASFLKQGQGILNWVVSKIDKLEVTLVLKNNTNEVKVLRIP